MEKNIPNHTKFYIFAYKASILLFFAVVFCTVTYKLLEKEVNAQTHAGRLLWEEPFSEARLMNHLLRRSIVTLMSG